MNNLEQNNQLIADVFKKEKAFVTFITAGDPSLDKTAEFILEMDKRGADIIEIGIPFSDPIAEGPVIQGADQRALAAGFSIDKMFAMVESLQGRVKAPLLFMTYINPIFTYGKDKFFSKCSQAGIVGVIVPDMPYEEKEVRIPYTMSDDFITSFWVAAKLTCNGRIYFAFDSVKGERHNVWAHEFFSKIIEDNGSIKKILEM